MTPDERATLIADILHEAEWLANRHPNDQGTLISVQRLREYAAALREPVDQTLAILRDVQEGE